jgi:hypothetical protein
VTGIAALCASVWRETVAPERRVQQAVEQHAEDEEDRGHDRYVGSEVGQAGVARHREAGDRAGNRSHDLNRRSREDAKRLPREQLVRTQQPEQHFHHAGRLLLDHSGQHPVAVHHEHEVQPHRREGSDTTAFVLVLCRIGAIE